MVYPTSSAIDKHACNYYSLLGNSFYESGSYKINLSNHLGCDSIITLNLIIDTPSYGKISVKTCKSFTLNSITYYKSGTYNQNLVNKKGCDSLLTIKLILGNSDSTLNVERCQNYVLNTVTYDKSGTYIQKLKTKNFCDSIVTLNLTINKIITTVTWSDNTLSADANEPGTSYKWAFCEKDIVPIDGANMKTFKPDKNGNYAVIIKNNNCTDTSECIAFTNLSVINMRNNNIEIWPNPCNSKLNISFNHFITNGTIQLFNANGKCFYIQNLDQEKNIELDLSNYSNGFYYLMLKDRNSISSFKILKSDNY